MKKNLTWQEAKTAARDRAPTIIDLVAAHISQYGTPPDCIPMTAYRTEDDYIAILGTETEWNWHEHNMVNQALGRILRKQKIPVKFFNLTADEYFKWLGPRENNTQHRACYATHLSKQ